MTRSLILPSVLLSSLVLVVGACGGDDDDAASSGDDVVGVVWELAELDGDEVPEDVTPTIEYDGTRVTGSSGCNTYGADATFDDGAVALSSEIAATLMACMPPADEVEVAFLAALPTVDTFEVDGDTLTLRSGDDQVMVFTR